MRAFAQYVMRGRTEATLAAVFATITVLFAWLGAAVIALVTLSRGASQGYFVLLWALVPATVLLWLGDTGPFALLIAAMVAAMVLRSTGSWPLTLIITALFGLLTSLYMLLLGQEAIEALLQLLTNFFAQQLIPLDNINNGELVDQTSRMQTAEVMLPNNWQIAGLFGFSNALTISLCLVLARWWQASLYHPGGFKTEFQQFRIPPLLTVILLLLCLILSMLGADFRYWIFTAAIPFIFAGFGLVHAIASQQKLNKLWLGLFYIFWLLFDPLKVLLVFVVIADSWLDIRQRLRNA
jgi:hypothetical protein